MEYSSGQSKIAANISSSTGGGGASTSSTAPPGQTLNESLMVEEKQSIVCFVTFGMDNKNNTHNTSTTSPKTASKKMIIRQVCYSNNIKDSDRDISYLENLQSICYPEGITQQQLTLKCVSFPKQGGSPNIRNNKQLLEDKEELNSLKQHTLTHYSITTNMGVKRYLSILLCKEPILNTPDQLNKNILQPFAYVIVMEKPEFSITREILKSFFTNSLVPYYEMLCAQDPSARHSSVQPIRLELYLSMMFGLLNTFSRGVLAKSISEFRPNKVPTIMESKRLYDSVFCPANTDMVQLWRKISPKNIIQLFNCIILEKKIILISRNIHLNAVLIEALLELLAPLDKQVYANISYIKEDMIDYLDTPLPFVIGISSSIWNKIIMTKWNEVSDDTVAFDIDTELLMTKVDLPNSPTPITSILLQTLTDIQGKSDHLQPKDLKIQLKQAFFNYLLLLINDFRFYYKLTYEQSISPQHVKSDSPAYTSPLNDVQQPISPRLCVDQFFSFDQYLEDQKIENQDFYSQFIETQMFNDLIERSFRVSENVDDRPLNYFLECLQILTNRDSFIDVVYHQQRLINATCVDLQSNTSVYNFHEIIEAYERALACSANIKSVVSTDESNSISGGGGGGSWNSIFDYKPQLLCYSLTAEITRHNYIKSLINKPVKSKTKAPSKNHFQAITAGNSKRNLLAKQQTPLQLNQPSDVLQEENIDDIYFQMNGLKKVSTPKGLRSESQTDILIGEDLDSNSLERVDQHGSASLEEEKSEGSASIKSFFQQTLLKIQSKLRSSTVEQQQQDNSLKGERSRSIQAVIAGKGSRNTGGGIGSAGIEDINIDREEIMTLSPQPFQKAVRLFDIAGKEQIRNLTMELLAIQEDNGGMSKPRLVHNHNSATESANSTMNSGVVGGGLYSGSGHHGGVTTAEKRGQASTIFGPNKQGVNFGRPKCFSETIAYQLKQGSGAGSQEFQHKMQLHGGATKNNNKQQNNANQDHIRPSAFSISTNKSGQDSPKSTTYTAESSSSISKGGRNDNFGGALNSGLQRTHIDLSGNTGINQKQGQAHIQGSSGGASGSNKQNYGYQQLSYPRFNQGLVMLKDTNKNTKKFVKKLNINLCMEEEKTRKSSRGSGGGTTTHSASGGAQTARSVGGGQDPSPREGGIQSGSANGSTSSLQQHSFSGQKQKSGSIQSINMPKTNLNSLIQNSVGKTSSGAAAMGSGITSTSGSTTTRQKAISQQNSLKIGNTSTQGVTTHSSHQSLQHNTSNVTSTPQRPPHEKQGSMKQKRGGVGGETELVNKSINGSIATTTKKNTNVQVSHKIIGSNQMHANSGSDTMRHEKLKKGQQQVQQKGVGTQKNSTNVIGQTSGMQMQSFDNIEGVQQRIRSISYTQNQTEFQSTAKFKMQKDKSQKSYKDLNAPTQSQSTFHPQQSHQMSTKPSKLNNPSSSDLLRSGGSMLPAQSYPQNQNNSVGQNYSFHEGSPSPNYEIESPAAAGTISDDHFTYFHQKIHNTKSVQSSFKKRVGGISEMKQGGEQEQYQVQDGSFLQQQYQQRDHQQQPQQYILSSSAESQSAHYLTQIPQSNRKLVRGGGNYGPGANTSSYDEIQVSAHSPDRSVNQSHQSIQ